MPIFPTFENLTIEERVTRLEALTGRMDLTLAGLSFRGGEVRLGDDGATVHYGDLAC